MLQVYPFYQYGDNVGEAYFQLNTFLSELACINVQIPMDQIRANTKTYPDYGTTATTIEVFVDLSDALAPHALASQIEELHAKVVHGHAETPAPVAEEKPVEVSAAGDFDPFLDGDDLP